VSTQEVEPIIKRAPEDVGTIPFQSTLSGRKELADRLTGYVERSGDGCVIGITAPWGEGKTYFGKNWRASLEIKEHKTFFLDAFQNDFSDDASTTITAEILRGLSKNDSKSKALLKAAKKLGANLLPALTKASIAAVTNLATGLTQEELEEALKKAGESSAEAAERYVEKRLKEHEERLKTISHFKSALQEYCAVETKPVIFFIDELDRCRPPYAIQVIEHIKHFFDVPNLVFVLLLNREQLERSIQQAYGGERKDAANYLGKFVHLFLTLPHAQTNGLNGHQNLQGFCQNLAKSHGFPITDGLRNFITVLVNLAPHFGLSLRDLQRAFVHLRLARRYEDYGSGFAYLIALKLAYPDVFLSLQRDPIEGSKKPVEMMTALDLKEPDDYWGLFLLLHKVDAGLLTKPTPEERVRFSGWVHRPNRSALFDIITEIDLPEIGR
jgi:KAP family P-loop domain